MEAMGGRVNIMCGEIFGEGEFALEVGGGRWGDRVGGPPTPTPIDAQGQRPRPRA